MCITRISEFAIRTLREGSFIIYSKGKQHVKRFSVLIPQKKNDIVQMKKLKKDGSIDSKTFRLIVNTILKKKIVLLPVDCLYGFVGLIESSALKSIAELSAKKEKDIVRMVSTFRMLDGIAAVSKLEYDFLHRVWPGEVIVYLRDREGEGKSIPVRMPRSRYFIDLINQINKPLLFSVAPDIGNWHIYDKNRIIKLYRSRVDTMVLIDEFCKEHNEPTMVDVSGGTIDSLNEGRVPAEEIKSLYFLGKDDVPL
jgi:tRNA A37 threonylcarbamoyladenosine synthetase subunit TsaC/SUA5/YrdC